jgi:hypothetical protein
MQLSTDPPGSRTPPLTAAARAAAARWAPRSDEIDPRDEDTIELELTPNQLRELEESAQRAFARKRENVLVTAPRLTVVSAPPQAPAPQVMAPIVLAPPEPVVAAPVIESAEAAEAPRHSPWRARRMLLVVAIAIALLVIAAAVIRLSTSGPALERQPLPASVVPRPSSPPPMTVTQAPPAPVVDVVAPVASSEPVRFANPFDRSEVFEFPPGTTRDEARDAVAQLLIERARERRHR